VTVRCAACGTRFPARRESCPRCAHRRPGSAGPSEAGRLIGLTLLTLLAAIGLILAFTTSPLGTHADGRALGSSTSLEHLDTSFEQLDEADRALDEDRYADAERHVIEAGHHLDVAAQVFAHEDEHLDPESRAVLERGLALAEDAHAVRADEVAWTQALEANETQMADDEDPAEQAEALAGADERLQRGDELAEQHRSVADEARSFAVQQPLVAASTPLPTDEDVAERPGEEARDHARAVEDARVDLAFTRAPSVKASMAEADRRALEQYNPPALADKMASMDADGDAELDPEEAVAFYEWVQENVDYRHDDEDAEPKIEGTPVGDGREGTDYQQSPAETFAERRGDCEDTALLHAAFHRYWGKTAYLALSTTEPNGAVNHATTIVRVEDPSAFPEPEQGFHTYRFPRGNPLGVEPGTYLIVDDTYSDTYGTISGGVEPGAFEIDEVEPLAKSMSYSDDYAPVAP
jgi:hypothetical protein